MFWDQSTALSPPELQRRWTELTNLSVSYR